MGIFGWTEGLAAALTQWNLCYGALDIFSSVAVIAVGWKFAQNEAGMCSHPVLLAMAILAKWFHLILGCMCFEAFGLNVLPAFYAATRAESLWFICYAIMAFIAALQAYWSFP